jgi:hypothetical protein
MRKTILSLLLFGAAFGYLEAAVVSYLRALHAPEAQRLYPGRAPGELFPLLTVTPERKKIGATEIWREAATMLMLAAVALAAARSFGQWAAAFCIAFGAWDIAFYAFLKVLLDWPASLYTWDILFLIPVPWVGPVLAPAMVSASMIAAGVWHLRRGAPRLGAWQWAGITLGAAVIILSFTLDYRNILRGGMPNPFRWDVFALGEAVGLVSVAGKARSR